MASKIQMRWNHIYDLNIQLKLILLIEGDNDSLSNERYYPMLMKDIIYWE